MKVDWYGHFYGNAPDAPPDLKNAIEVHVSSPEYKDGSPEAIALPSRIRETLSLSTEIIIDLLRGDAVETQSLRTERES